MPYQAIENYEIKVNVDGTIGLCYGPELPEGAGIQLDSDQRRRRLVCPVPFLWTGETLLWPELETEQFLKVKDIR
jgi:hypothetical protein